VVNSLFSELGREERDERPDFFVPGWDGALEVTDLARRLGSMSKDRLKWWCEAPEGDIMDFTSKGYNASVNHSFANAEYAVGRCSLTPG
jgi:hypothetical protein